jgi:uncharacterized OB-fold protein
MPDLNTMTPVRPGLLQTHPPRLLGSWCEACDTRVFPARDFCPHCDSEAPPASVELSPTGTVFSYTVVRQAPGARPVPYVLAYVDLDDRVRVLAQLDEEPQAVHIEQRVQLVLRNVALPNEDARLGYAFAPLPSPTGLEEPNT